MTNNKIENIFQKVFPKHIKKNNESRTWAFNKIHAKIKLLEHKKMKKKKITQVFERAQKLEEQKTISGENLPDDELLSLFYIKEKIAREMIEKRFPAPQITNSKFNEVLNNVKEVVESQVEILNALTPTEKTKYEIESRENSIKQLISKIDDLTNELILSEGARQI